MKQIGNIYQGCNHIDICSMINFLFYASIITNLSLCSCLIARNMLSGLKTCTEVSNFMDNDGSTMSHRSIAASTSLMEDSGDADITYTVSIESLICKISREGNNSPLS